MKPFQIRALVGAISIALAPAAFAAPGTATANVASSQTSVGSEHLGVATLNSASLNRHVLQNAKGNVGVNVAAGSANVEANNANIATTAGKLTPKTNTYANVSSSQVGNAFSQSQVQGDVNHATLSGHVLQNASGNIGVNVAAGSDSMQANNLALSQGQGEIPSGVADSSVSSVQVSGPLSLLQSRDAMNTATLGDHVLQNVSGNVGVNVAAGEQNMGVNNLAVSYNRGGLVASASAANAQASVAMLAMTGASTNTATLNNDVLENASGNVNVNDAAGVQNMQGNSLSLSTARSVYPYAPTPTGGTSTATVASIQMGGLTSSASNTRSDNDAGLDGHVLQHATGNIGANVAAGAQNMQSNATAMALSFGTVTDGVASAAVRNNQAGGPFDRSSSFSADNDARLNDHVLQQASGNVGVNVAGGTQNMQANNLAYGYNNAGQIAATLIDNDQGTERFAGNAARISEAAFARNNAEMHNHVLQDASGNIGANVAAGDLNAQTNNLAIATAAGAMGSATYSLATIADSQLSNQGSGAPIGMGSPSAGVDIIGSETSRLSGHVLQNASGNIGVNVAAGLQNLQANNTAMSLAWGTNLGGNAMASVTGTQQSGPWFVGANLSTRDTASVGDHVLQNASGKVGANVASGVENMQSNDLAYAFNQGGSNAAALSKVSQVSLGAISANAPLLMFRQGFMPTTNTASVSGHVLQNAAGDIGLNVAAGAGNMQRNTLTIADAD